ncbi:hypothetical protein NSK_000544 [Nannochloropsis salina CCMP1776]|uniref:K Homology domain-containing protein n=1 Tax=Nannochloropsis salina CCMP1776 TaxID=1027361 RepID=A0A4D9D9B4_9STRA|nr:hypothetical protein NSK_000544 [Nannochloropsis salina CCMP1776]|eukprot:TFJ88192.1 hypothetical protein NSK_000544 [Nannochloropsis salina CCMP1776]
MHEENMEEEGHMDLSEAAAGLVQATLRIAAPRVLLPGDTSEMPDHLSRAKLGNGLVSAHSPPRAAKATKAGILRFQAPNTYRIDNQQRRYVPKRDDMVLGIVEDRGPENYRLNIFASAPGYLPHLAFDGASKRNKPVLRAGSLVYCRVALACIDVDTELTCTVTQGIKKDWMTGESTFGELKGGTVTRCSLGLCRQLLDKDCRVLQVLQKHGVPFEVAVGRNGAFYVNAKDQGIIVAIVNILLNSEMIQDGSEEQMVKFVLKSISNRHRRSALLAPT